MILLLIYLAGVVGTLVGIGIFDAITLKPRKKFILELNSFYLLLAFGWPITYFILVIWAIWTLFQLMYIIPAFITCVIIERIKHK